MTWGFMMRAVRPDIIVHECEATFDAVELKRTLGPGFEVTSVVFHPTELGFPITRRRRCTVAYMVDKAED